LGLGQLYLCHTWNDVVVIVDDDDDDADNDGTNNK
jgi:hypothetical protein